MFRHDDKIQRSALRLPSNMVTKTLADDAFDPVPVNRPCTGFFRNSHAEAVKVITVGPCQDPKIIVIRSDGVLENQSEFDRFEQTGLPGKLHSSWPLGVYCVFLLPVSILAGRTRFLPGLVAVYRVVVRTTCYHADRRLRPLARRALITARPPRVAMRARKPCRRARFRLLG